MNARGAHLVANAVLFQLAWLVCVQGNNGLAVAVTALVMVFHWRIVMINRCEWRLWLVAFVLGFIVDSLLIAAGVLRLADGGLVQPLWMACLWILFAGTLLHSTSFLLRSVLLAATVGCLGGPLAYYIGSRFGAASLGSISFEMLSPLYANGIALVILAICWSIVTPVLVLIAQRIDRHANKFAWRDTR
jgi:hypothetical protein